MSSVVKASDALLDACSGRIYLGFSGGMDSVVLLHAVAGAARRRGMLARLTAVHVDHGLAAESARWADGCAAQAAEMGVSFVRESLRVAPGSNLEARARTARYAVFEQLLEAQDLLALAHHGGDQTESLLLHMLQGRGLYGMPRTRNLGQGRLARPFLSVDRDEIAGYARAHNLAWVEDPSNADLDLDRNFLRHAVLPLLATRFPALPKRLLQLAGNAAANSQALVELAGLDRHPLPLSVLDGSSRPVRLTLLRHWLIRQGGGAGVSSASLEEFLVQLDAANDRQPSLMTPAGRLVRYRRQLYLVAAPPVLEDEYRLEAPASLVLPHGVLALARSPSGSDGRHATAIELMAPIRVSFLPALPAGASLLLGGYNRQPRELMRDAGIPPWERESWPVLLDALGVAALPGIADRDAPPSDADGKAASLVRYDVRWTPDVH